MSHGNTHSGPDEESDESILSRLSSEAGRIARGDLDELGPFGLEPEELDEGPPLDEIAQVVRGRLGLLGLRDPESINASTIQDLGEIYLDLNEYDVEDLFFQLLGDSLNEFEPIYFQDLVEEIRVKEVDIRSEQVERTREASEFLVGIGINQLEMFKWGLVGTPRQKRALRRMGWLLNRGYMADFQEAVKKATQSEPVRFKEVASNIAPEVERLNRLVETYEATHELTRREKLEMDFYKRRLDRARAVCELVFIPDITEGVYDEEI